jgi:divalent metal cation (Fe/Co/Zn/Cd) transporter
MIVEQLRSSHVNNSVIVHIDELLDEQHRENVESIVEQVNGVTNAHFNETRHHLMVVDYDPKITNSSTILNRVKRQHLHAQLI